MKLYVSQFEGFRRTIIEQEALRPHYRQFIDALAASVSNAETPEQLRSRFTVFLRQWKQTHQSNE